METPVPDDDGRAARRRAAVAGHQGDEATARALLGHPDAVVASTALGALSRMERVTQADLAAAATDPRATVRSRAATVAAAHPDLVIDLTALLGDPDPTVVEVAAWACGERATDPATVGRLAELATGHDDALVREAAVAALGSLGDPAGLPAILAATRDKATVRRRAVLALAPFEGPEVDAALAAARTDRDWQVRQAGEDLTSEAEPGG